MKAKIEVTLRSFVVPSSVQLEGMYEYDDEPMSLPLSEIDEYTLMSLCEDFQRRVFEIAKKTPPPQPACTCK